MLAFLFYADEIGHWWWQVLGAAGPCSVSDGKPLICYGITSQPVLKQGKGFRSQNPMDITRCELRRQELVMEALKRKSSHTVEYHESKISSVFGMLKSTHSSCLTATMDSSCLYVKPEQQCIQVACMSNPSSNGFMILVCRTRAATKSGYLYVKSK